MHILIVGLWMQGPEFLSFRECERRGVALGLRCVNVNVNVDVSRGHSFL